jgi:excisionase family DNA binding protein
MNTPGQSSSPSLSGRLAYSIQETAQMLGVCDKSVRRLILRGLIRPSRALRRHILVPKDEIDRFLRETR